MTNNSMENLFLRSLRSKQTVVTIIALILFVAVVSFVLFEGTKKSVTLTANGKQQEISTHANTVGELLEDQNIKVADQDLVSPSLDTKVANGLAIEWEQATEVTISVDGENKSLWTTEKDVKDILAKAGIEVAEYDQLTPALDAKVGSDNKIDIKKAFQVTLVDGGNEKNVWSTSTTVADFLKQQEIQLNEFDRVDKGMEELITPDQVVNVVRVEKVTDVVEEATDFAVETKKDSSLLKGDEKVVQEGQQGIVSKTYEVVKENGQVVAKNLVGEEVVKEPTTKVVSLGTKIETASVSRGTAGSEPNVGKEFYVEATAYTPNCSGCSGKTATGIDIKANPTMKLIAVDPSVIPLGSKVWVEGYGYAIAGDTGGAIKGNKIDLLMPTQEQAYKFGRKKVRIKVLN